MDRPGPAIPPDVQRFVLTSVPSVPFLEAVLLFVALLASLTSLAAPCAASGAWDAQKSNCSRAIKTSPMSAPTTLAPRSSKILCVTPASALRRM